MPESLSPFSAPDDERGGACALDRVELLRHERQSQPPIGPFCEHAPVDGHNAIGHDGPGVSDGDDASGSAHASAETGVREKIIEGACEGNRVPRWNEPSAVRLDHLPVARDGRGDNRDSSGHCFGEDDPEALTLESGSAEDARSGEQRLARFIVDSSMGVYALARRRRKGRPATGDVGCRWADEVESRTGPKPTECLQEKGETLAPLRPPDEENPTIARASGVHSRSSRKIDAVRDHRVPARASARHVPTSSLRNGDTRVEAGERAPAKRREYLVPARAWRIGVEGADEGSAGGEDRGQRDRRDHRLVDVDEVVPRRANSSHRAGSGGRTERDADDLSVVEDRHAPPKGNDILSDTSVDGSENLGFDPVRPERAGESADMALDAAGVAPRVGADERDLHRLHLEELVQAGEDG